jgi:hypothetical protein
MATSSFRGRATTARSKLLGVVEMHGLTTGTSQAGKSGAGAADSTQYRRRSGAAAQLKDAVES